MKYYRELIMAVRHGPGTSSGICYVKGNKEKEKTRSEDVQDLQPLLQTVGKSKCKLEDSGKDLPWEEMPLFSLESRPSLGDSPQFN